MVGDRWLSFWSVTGNDDQDIYMRTLKKRYRLGSGLGVVERGFTSGSGVVLNCIWWMDAAEAFEANVNRNRGGRCGPGTSVGSE